MNTIGLTDDIFQDLKSYLATAHPAQRDLRPATVENWTGNNFKPFYITDARSGHVK